MKAWVVRQWSHWSQLNMKGRRGQLPLLCQQHPVGGALVEELQENEKTTEGR